MDEYQLEQWDSAVKEACAKLRMDANETAVFSRELEHAVATLYETEFVELNANQLFLPDPPADVADESYRMRHMEGKAEAKIIANWDNKLPTASYGGGERSYPIRSLANAYIWTLQDARVAAKTGLPLDTKLAEACKRAHAELLETCQLTGDAASGVNGLFSAANGVITARAVAKVGVTWNNAAVTFAVILRDFTAMWEKVVGDTKGKRKPTTFAVGTRAMLAITKPLDMGGGIYRSIWELLLASYGPMGLKELIHVPSFDTMAAGSTDRVMLYTKDVRVAASQTPEFFTQLAPQAQGLTMVVPCHSRVGGVHVEEPLAFAYMDGTIS